MVVVVKQNQTKLKLNETIRDTLVGIEVLNHKTMKKMKKKKKHFNISGKVEKESCGM